MDRDKDLKAKNRKTLIVLILLALGFYAAYMLMTALGG
jgi:predicted negative regulator of RcsB-dependent stress response